MRALEKGEPGLLEASRRAEKRRVAEEEERQRQLREAREREEQARRDKEQETALRLKEQEEANRKLRKRAFLAGGIAILTLVSAVLAGRFGYESGTMQAENRRCEDQKVAESRRLAARSDSVRPIRLDQAMLLALEASGRGTFEARGSLQRCIDNRREVSRFLDIPEGESRAWPSARGAPSPRDTTRGAGVGGVVLLDAKGERLRTHPVEVKEGDVTSVAFGPGGIIAAGYSRGVGGGVVLLDAKGERLRADPVEVKEGGVTSVAFGPGGTIAAGYARGVGRRRRGAAGREGGAAPGPRRRGQGGRCHERGLRPGGHHRRGIRAPRRRSASAAWCCSTRRGERLRAHAVEVKEGECHERGLRPGGHHRRGILARRRRRRRGAAATRRGSGSGPTPSRSRRAMSRAWPSARGASSPRDTRAAAAAAAAWCCSTRRGSGSGPHPVEVKEGGVTSVAFGPGGIIAAGYGASASSAAWCCSDAKGERLRARPRRGQGGRCHERGLRPGGHHRRGISRRRRRRRGAARREGGAAPGPPRRGQGGRCHERGLRPGGHHRRGILRAASAAGVVLLDAKGRAAPGPTPVEVKEGGVTSVAFGPAGIIAAGYSRGGGRRRRCGAARREGGAAPGLTPSRSRRGMSRRVAFGPGGTDRRGIRASPRPHVGGVVLLDAKGERLWARAVEVKEGGCHERGLRAGGHHRRGIRRGCVGGGVVLLDAKGEPLRAASRRG